MSIPIIDDIKSSLEYYDSHQPKIIELVNNLMWRGISGFPRN